MKLPLIVASGLAGALSASLPAQSEDIQIVTTAWAQRATFDVPDRFVPGYDNVSGKEYILELVLKGQTVHSWSEMITLTASQGNSGSAASFAQRMRKAYGEACPETYSAGDLSPPKIGGAKAVAAAYLGCGDLGGYSEAMVFVAIDGAEDLYSLQWAERSDALSRPPAFDAALWNPRLEQFSTAAFCNPTGDEGSGLEPCGN